MSLLRGPTGGLGLNFFRVLRRPRLQVWSSSSCPIWLERRSWSTLRQACRPRCPISLSRWRDWSSGPSWAAWRASPSCISIKRGRKDT